MWRDPMDELIADLETVAAPERGTRSEALVELQRDAKRCLMAWMDDPDAPVVPQTAEERRHYEGLINRLVGRDEDAGPLPRRSAPRREVADERPPHA